MRSAAFILPILLACSLPATDLTTYRGVDGSGTYDEDGLRRTWPAEGPPLLWRVPVGHGWGGPAVVGDRVYIVGGQTARLQVYALADGRSLGEVTVASAVWKRFTGSRTLPVIADGMAVAGMPNGTLVGVELSTLEPRWSRNVWQEVGSGKGNMGWGWPETPGRHGNRLIVNPCSRDLATPPLVAIDIRTGRSVWEMSQQPLPDGSAKRYSAGDVSGVVFEHRGRVLVAYPTWRYLVVADAATGQHLWEIPSEGEHTLPPVYIRERGWLLANLIPPGRKDQALTCLELSPDGAAATVRWRRLGAAAGFGFAAVAGDRIGTFGSPVAAVLAADGSEAIPAPAIDPRVKPAAALLCLDLETGRLIGQADAHLGAGAHVVAAEGLFYVSDHATKAAEFVEQPPPEKKAKDQSFGSIEPLRLRLVRPGADGLTVTGTLIVQIRNAADLGGASANDVSWNAAVSPVIAHGRLFVRYGALHVFDLRAEPAVTGGRGAGDRGVIHGATAPLPASRITNRRWLADDAPGAAVANGDLILHPGAPDSIIARDAATGTERWRTVVGAPVTGVVLREDAAIVLAGDRLRRLDLATGTEAWQATAAGAVVPPLVGGGMALVQGQDGLAALALADGREHWRVPVAAGPVAPVRLRCGDDDLVATPDGRVLRIADGNLVATGLPVAAFHLGTGARLFTIAADGILTATGLREGTAGPTVATLWTVAMATPVGQPLLTEGRLFVPAGTAIVVLDPATGTERGRLALTASLSAPPLAAAGHLWLPGAGGPETTVVATLDAAPVEVWRYTTAGGARLPLFTSGGVILRAGGQLHALLGPAPQEPLALDPVEIPATDRPADLQPFASDILPERWLWAGPIPGKDPDQDHLADLGGRSRAAIAENSKFTVAGREFSFVPLPDTGLVCNQYTGNRPVIELVRIHGKVWNTTGYYTTTIDNDAERLVRFASLLPGGRPWPARLDLRCYLDGIPIDERLPLRLGPGRHRLLIAAGIGQCEDWGMIFMVPRFIDGGEALAAEVVRNRQARDDWRRYQAEEAGKPFLLP